MGDDFDSGVVDAQWRGIRGPGSGAPCPGLYVLDGSIIPGPLWA